jgi:hypothetical protein
MLDAWERATTDEVIERVEREGGNARAKLRRTFELTCAEAGAETARGLETISEMERRWSRRSNRRAQASAVLTALHGSAWR